MAANKYTELEWCVGVQAPAVKNEIYEFRVYYDSAGTALDSYLVTPQLTIDETGATVRLHVTRSTLVL